jgi:hypothetical protein
MNVFGTSRFTALLAAVALSGTAGTFWWALETRTDMKAAASNRVLSRSVPVKAGGRAPRWKEEHAGKTDGSKTDGSKFDASISKSESDKFEPGKFELMGKSERPQPNLPKGPAGREDDADRAPDRSITPRLANYPIPAPSYPNSGQQPAASRSSSPGPQSGRADMPLPAMPATLDSAPAPTPAWQASRAAVPLAFAPSTPAQPAPPQQPPPAETLKRQTREPKAEPPPAAMAARQPRTPSFYTEQFIEQGEFRYRRRPCEPPNMPDVCFMPQADRHPIVVAKP